MRKGLKWLMFVSIAIAVAVGVLLVLAFVPAIRVGRPHEYWMWERTHLDNPWVFLGTVAIVLLMLAIPLSHIAWLVLATIWLSRSAKPPHTERALSCPSCGAKVQLDWQMCPYCGAMLEAGSNDER